MIDFIDSYMTDANAYEEYEHDEQRIMLKAVSKVLPKIIENELTPRQSLCLRLFYVHNKSQTEIARELKLSQPTVSRHISTAKAITNKCLYYCCLAVKNANAEWQKIEL